MFTNITKCAIIEKSLSHVRLVLLAGLETSIIIFYHQHLDCTWLESCECCRVSVITSPTDNYHAIIVKKSEYLRLIVVILHYFAGKLEKTGLWFFYLFYHVDIFILHYLPYFKFADFNNLKTECKEKKIMYAGPLILWCVHTPP